MFYMKGVCSRCRAGVLGFRRCSDKATIVLMCDECHLVWLRPDRIAVEEGISPDPPAFVVPGLTCSIKRPEADWATREDIKRVGWQALIFDEYIPSE